MKILQIHNNYFKKGGAETVFLNTIELLRKKKHLVMSFSQRSDFDIFSKYENFYSDPNSLIHNRFYSFESKIKLKKLLAEEKPEIAHIHNIVGGITFSILPVLKKYNIPIVATIHDYRYLCPVYDFINGKNEICEKCKTGKYYNCFIQNCSDRGRLRSCLLTIESYLRDILTPYAKLIDSFIFVSNFIQEKFLEVKPDLYNRSYRLYNFSNHSEKTLSHNNYFLYFGRIMKEKGLYTLLEAFKKLPNQKLIVVGDGEIRNELEEKKSSNIQFLDFKSGNDLYDKIKNALYVLVPSEWYENNPLAIIEAFSFGKPVIGSNIGGIPELVTQNKTGFLFEPGNVQQLIDTVENTERIDQSKYNELCDNAFQFFQDNFTDEIHYNRLMTVYKETIKRNNENVRY